MWFSIKLNMDFNAEQARQEQLDSLIPAALKDGKGKRMLYVGGHLRYGRNLQMSHYFLECGYKIDVIEVFPANVMQLQKVEWISRLTEGDIRYYDPMRTYDLTVFWHGPEHLTKEEVTELLQNMKRYSNAVIFATPNGHYDQGEEYGNTAENHLSDWTAADFDQLGMTASAIGEPNQRNGNVVAYWMKTGPNG